MAKLSKELGPILLINSDIDLFGDLGRLIEAAESSKSIAGIRCNFSNGWHQGGEMEAWGIDAYLIHPAQVTELPDLPLIIGEPMWDYWLAYHFIENGQKLDWVLDRFFYHEKHELNWNQQQWRANADVFLRHYQLPEPDWVEFRKQWPQA